VFASLSFSNPFERVKGFMLIGTQEIRTPAKVDGIMLKINTTFFQIEAYSIPPASAHNQLTGQSQEIKLEGLRVPHLSLTPAALFKRTLLGASSPSRPAMVLTPVNAIGILRIYRRHSESHIHNHHESMLPRTLLGSSDAVG
jgi:hypothetical protein